MEFNNAKQIVEDNLQKLMELFIKSEILLEDLGTDVEEINKFKASVIESIMIIGDMLDNAKTIEELDYINKRICGAGAMLTI